jgi:hypothetical protein
MDELDPRPRRHALPGPLARSMASDGCAMRGAQALRRRSLLRMAGRYDALMPRRALASCVVLLGAVLAFGRAHAVETGPPQTVCTITVNSPDEKEAFRRHLPEGRYRFVELVERGRPDWLASACQARVACDMLVISGHYDGGNEFFSDKLDVNEFLTVSELERVSCSESCPTLFSRLKEVYLFGCNTLNADTQSVASAEIVRSLVREGLTRGQAERELRSLAAAHGESSRDRMRQIFYGVPVIYGFSSTAPLGPTAGAVLERYLRRAGDREIGRGRPANGLLDAFSPFGLTATAGMTDKDPHLAARADMCQFADERLSPASQLAFVHELLQRHIGESRLQLDRIQRLMASLDGPRRREPAVAQELEEIARDAVARERFLDYARAVEQPPVRVRLLDLAQDVGWLTPQARRDEIVRMLRELQQKAALGVPEVNLACTMNQDRSLDGAFDRSLALPSGADDVAHAAVRACLGSGEDRARTLRALLEPRDDDARVAQAYLRHRPLTDDGELRRLTDGIAAMAPGDAQAHALEALTSHYVADRQVLDRLIRLFAETPSAQVQAAIAGILIRADLRGIAAEPLLRTLLEHRQASPRGREDMIDALIGVLRSR